MDDPASRLRTRPSLLLRLRDLTDADAWRLFSDTYAPLVYRHLRRQGLQEADSADVAQEVLTQVARSIGTFEYQPERGRFRDWLGAVVRSKIARFYRSRGRDVAGAGGDDQESLLQDLAVAASDSAWIAEFNDHVVRVALDRIRPDYDPRNWRAFEMTWLEDRPAPEVARALDMAVSAVYVAKSRVLARLREEVLTLAEDIPHLFPTDGSGDGG